MLRLLTKWKMLCIAVMAVALSGCVGLPEGGAMTDTGTEMMSGQRVLTSEIKTHASRGPEQVIAGAEAQIVHTDDGVMMSFETSELTPGNVYTAWWVFFNKPEECATLPCTAADGIGNTEVVVSDLGYADGLIADADGNGTFTAFQPVGPLSNSWFDRGYSNLGGAEIHVIINEHGPSTTGNLENMLTSYRGGCTDESIPPPFPASARADGIPGPNPCVLYQFAIFMPQEAELEMAASVSQNVSTHGSRGDVTVVDGAMSQLVHTDDGTFMSFETSELTPGNVYTAWWVFFNKPEECATIPCTAADGIGNTEVVVSDLGYADGLIADADGNGRFIAFQPVGPLSNAWFDRGYSNLSGSEIHVIINEHGPAIDGLVEDMLSSYRGGCTTESIPAPFPDTARADGTPGPNPCQLFQFSIFTP